MIEQVNKKIIKIIIEGPDLVTRTIATIDPATTKTTLLIKNVTIHVSVKVAMERPLTRSRSRSYQKKIKMDKKVESRLELVNN